MFIRRGFAVSAAVAAAIAAFSPALYADSHSIAEFAIPAQPLSTALIDLSKQANIQILTAGSAVDGVRAPAVNGRLTLEAALERLLKDSEFEYRFVDRSTLVLSPKKPQSAATMMRTAQLVEGSEAAASAVAQPGASESASGADANAERRVMLEEVIVTGSHIRGAQNLSSPVITFDREDIEASGYATMQQLIQGLPQNLNNIADSTVSYVNGGPGWEFGGSAVNLRGLGSDSTLVLLNGRRLAAAGTGNFVDISLIPLSAIDRVEILTDGASAIYGSDAVGGVVNLILRKDFEGAETRVRYGTVTEGSHSEWQFGQTLGHAWESGRSLIAAEYVRRTDLDHSDRDFIELSGGLTKLKLIPGQERASLFGTFSQQVSDAMELAGEVFYGQRESALGWGGGTPLEIIGSGQQLGGSLGVTLSLPAGWEGRASGMIDQSESEEERFESGTSLIRYQSEYRLLSADIAADGRMGLLPGGDVRLALGAQFRNERLVDETSGLADKLQRDVAALYAELNAPWVTHVNARPGVQRLEVTLAGRLEDYSDFGSTFNPKLGVAWAPWDSLNVRSTWGTSFKAPLFTQMSPAGTAVVVYERAYADEQGLATVIQLSGSRRGLGAEESTNRTFGFDWKPTVARGLELSATYFDIDYRDRVSEPFPSGYETQSRVLQDASYAFLVTRQPTLQNVVALLERPGTMCVRADWTFCESMPQSADIGAIVDGRVRNLAAVRMSGMDFDVSYQWGTKLGQWAVQLAGTKILKNREQVIASAPPVDRINDVYQPVDLRLNSSLSFTRGSLSTSATVSYVDDYRDTRTSGFVGAQQRSTVPSWTTVDMTLRYDLSKLLSNVLSQGAITLSATNVLDRDPPFVSHLWGINYDGVNASALGRFVSAQITAQWGR